MTERLGRVRQAFRDHGGFEQVDEDTFELVTTPFDASVRVTDGDDTLTFHVDVRVPMLSAVTADAVAPVVEEGWFETFELRVEDAGGITRSDHDLTPVVENGNGEAVVRMQFEECEERRAVDDAVALVNFVEGTYVQGVIPGYEYEPPVSDLLSDAYQSAEDV
jgi:hypothetical protein